jgi:biotin transport system ATP-binding protein
MKMERIEVRNAKTDLSGLSLEGVCFEVAGRQILEDLSLRTESARIGIVGRNGSGKSTLSRLIAGLIKPSSGSILVNGISPAKDRKAALTEVGILFQNPDHQIIFPTVQEEIAFGLRQLGQTRDEAAQGTERTLARFGKSHWIDANVSTLSQGQKQLLCLMAISAMQPKTVILDEPLSGLDIPTGIQLQKYFSGYPGNLIHITHNPEDLREFDFALWLEGGRLVDFGSCDDVLVQYKAQMKKWGATDDISDLSD